MDLVDYGELESRGAAEVAPALVDLLFNSHQWVNRRVDSVSFPDDVTITRSVSVDFRIPSAAPAISIGATAATAARSREGGHGTGTPVRRKNSPMIRPSPLKATRNSPGFFSMCSGTLTTVASPEGTRRGVPCDT